MQLNYLSSNSNTCKFYLLNDLYAISDGCVATTFILGPAKILGSLLFIKYP